MFRSWTDPLKPDPVTDAMSTFEIFLARKPSVLPVPGVKLSEPYSILRTEGTGRAPELDHRLRKTMFIDENHGFLKRHFPETNPMRDAHFFTAV